jgi:lipid-A-disaccharide synthase
MSPQRIMLIAGEASGDALGAELVKALTSQLGAKPQMFGAGGSKMAEAGVDVIVDMTAHSVIGLIEVVKKYFWFKKVFEQLKQVAIDRQPDLIICVDFGVFNQRFAHAIREYTRSSANSKKWDPKIVRFVSPQVWASRPGRANKMAQDVDLLLCLFPFEKEWYAKRTPQLKVEFVGHPICDRSDRPSEKQGSTATPTIVLLPGSRVGELKKHLPVMIDTAKKILETQKAHFKMILPNERLAAQARALEVEQISNLEIHVGDPAGPLSEATIAISKTGTITLECAYFGVPTIAMYKTSWSTYQIGKRIVQVKYLAMPNLLADEVIFPELIQNDATADKITTEAIDLLNNANRREMIKSKLTKVIALLGGPGASGRAARAVLQLFKKG